jgi:AAA family ATP:ADP antiporter
VSKASVRSAPTVAVDDSAWRRLLSRLGVDLRSGEGLPAVLLFLYFFLIITFQYTTKSLRQAEYITKLGAQALPLSYFLVAVCSLPVLLVYSRSVDRVPRHHLIAVTSILVAGSLVGFFFLFQLESQVVPVVFYVWISIVYVLNVSQFWSYSNHVFDPRQAKRLFGFIGAGGLLGGIAGGQVAAVTTKVAGTYASLFVAAVVLVLAGCLIYVIQRHRPSEDSSTAGAAGLGKLEEAKGGFQAILRSRHLQLVAAIMLLTVMVAQVVDVQFGDAVERSTTTLAQRTEFFGNFYSIMGVSALIFQLLFTSRIHRRLGIGFAIRVLPVTMALGTVAILGAAAFAPMLLLAAALSLKIGENGLRYSLDQATRELLFLPVPSRARLKAKATIDVFIQRLGKGTGALLLIPVFFGVMPPIQAGWIALGLIAVWLAVTVMMRRQYVQSFREGLESTEVDAASPIDLSDATSLELLIQALDSSDPRQVINSLELLESNDKAHLVPRLMLSHSDPAVRCRTLKVFSACRREDAVAAVERVLSDDSIEVRVEAVRTLAALQSSDAIALMLPRLDDPDIRIRAAAISAVAGYSDEATGKAAGSLSGLVVDDRWEARAEAARILGEIPDPLFENQLIRLLYDSDHRVAREAVRSTQARIERDAFNPIYAPILISALRHRRLKHEARSAIVSCGEQIVPALVHFQNDPDEQVWVRRAIPKTISRIDSPSARRALAESLSSEDSFLRRKVIEALGALRPEDDPALRIEVRRGLSKEVKGYLRQLADLFGLGIDSEARFQGPRLVWEDRPPTLLHHLLTDRLGRQLDTTFLLLAVLHGRPKDISAAHRGLVGPDPGRRTHALEYLDNTLSGDVRTLVFTAIGDQRHEERFRRARELFGIEVESKEKTLRRLTSIPTEGDAEAAWLAASAVHAVYATEAAPLYPYVKNLSETASDPLVRETARWVVNRLGLAG